MQKTDIEDYVKALEIKPDSKYLLVVSDKTYVKPEELARLQLPHQIHAEILLIHGDPSLIQLIELKDKNV